MIDFDRGLVIIHPPKTGGVAVQKALGLTMPHHHNGKIIYRHETLNSLREKFPECRKFRICILIRNPYDRLESWFYYARIPGINLPTMNKLRREVMAAESFEGYVLSADWDDIFTRRTTVFGLHLKPMFAYVGAEAAEVVPVRLKNRSEELGRFMGAPIRVKPANQNPHKPALWTRRMRDVVYDAFHVDFYQYEYRR